MRHYKKIIIYISILFVFISFPVLYAEDKTQEKRIWKLIEARKEYSWDQLYLQFEPSLPPPYQPVSHIPEWETVGYLLMAFDESTISSLKLNEIFDSFDKGERLINATSGEKDKLADIMDTGDYFDYEIEKDTIFSKLAISHTLLRVIKTLSLDIKVVLLIGCNQDNEDELMDVLEIIKKFPEGNDILNSKNIIFLPSMLDTKWIRDYGPEIVRDNNNRMIILDSRYDICYMSKNKFDIYRQLIRSIAEEDEEENDEYNSTDRSEYTSLLRDLFQERSNDDASPSILALHMRQKINNRIQPTPIPVVRPPIMLQGGDFFSNGDTGFTSIETLKKNGGDIFNLNCVFDKYFGLKAMVYLIPLPGSAIPHIDMFFQVVSPNIYLLATFEERDGGDEKSPLQIKANRVLDVNERILTDFFLSQGKQVNVIRDDTHEFEENKVNIVRIPIPDLLRPVRTALKKIDEEENKLIYQAKLLIEEEKNLKKLIKFLNERIGKWGERKHLIEMFLESPEDIDIEILMIIEQKVRDFFRNKITDALEFTSVSPTHPLYLNFLAFGTLIKEDFKSIKQGDSQAIERLKNKLEKIKALIQLFLEDLRANHKRFLNSLKEVESDIELLRERFSHVKFEKDRLKEQKQRGMDVYKTYLNLHFIRTETQNILMIPSFNDNIELQTRSFKLIECAYTNAYGKVKIIPVPSDYLCHEQGAIHCLSKSIPSGIEFLVSDWGIHHISEEQ